ncbi:hypothetical protein FOZ61_004539, partial [Perkinsus olseni]
EENEGLIGQGATGPAVQNLHWRGPNLVMAVSSDLFRSLEASGQKTTQSATTAAGSAISRPAAPRGSRSNPSAVRQLLRLQRGPGPGWSPSPQGDQPPGDQSGLPLRRGTLPTDGGEDQLRPGPRGSALAAMLELLQLNLGKRRAAADLICSLGADIILGQEFPKQFPPTTYSHHGNKEGTAILLKNGLSGTTL